MSAASAAGTALRVLGTLAIFALLGPAVLACLALAVVLMFGAPVLHFLSDALHITINPEVMAIATFVLVMFVGLGSLLPMFGVGMVFAVAAFGFGRNQIWVAWLAAIAIFVIYLALGAVTSVSESSPFHLPGVGDWRQGLDVMRGLLLPGLIATSLCWLVSRPFHRVRSPA